MKGFGHILLLMIFVSSASAQTTAPQEKNDGAKTNAAGSQRLPMADSSSNPSSGSGRSSPCSGIGSGVVGGNTNYVAVQQEPNIGIKIAGYPKSLSRSTRWNTVYLVTFSGIKYSVTVDPKQLIVGVTTRDSGFKTSEGIAVGDSLEKVLAVAKPAAQRECLHTIRLGSGWDAYFDLLPDGSLAPDAKLVRFARVTPDAPTNK